MVIGLELAGSFGQDAGWTMEKLIALAQQADRSAIDFLILPDPIAGLDGGEAWPDATILAGYLASMTQRLGLILAATTGGHQPYNLARRLASLDLISQGRIGWCLTMGEAEPEAAAFSGAIRLPQGNPPARIAEFAQIVAGLYQSWDADALLIDREAGRFIDPAAMHELNHQGDFFSVRGPLNVMRSPQDRPMLLLRGKNLVALQGIAALVDAIIVDGAQVAAGDKPALREISFEELKQSQILSDDRQDLLVKVKSAHEAETCLQLLKTHAALDPQAATLRGRFGGTSKGVSQ